MKTLLFFFPIWLHTPSPFSYTVRRKIKRDESLMDILILLADGGCVLEGLELGFFLRGRRYREGKKGPNLTVKHMKLKRMISINKFFSVPKSPIQRGFAVQSF
jgi:hypothetical protein